MLTNGTSPPHSPLGGISVRIPTKNRHGEILGKTYGFGARGVHQKQPHEKQEQNPQREKGEKRCLQ